MRKHIHFPQVNIGRVGSVVYYERDGVMYLRSHSAPKNPRTKAQQANRGLYGELIRVSGLTKAFRARLFSGVDTYSNSHTAFIGLQLFWLKGLEGCDRYEVFKNIRWSIGDRVRPAWLSFQWDNTVSLLKWDVAQSYLAISEKSATALWVIYNADKDVWHYCLRGGRRDYGKLDMNLPVDWKGDRMTLWLVFYNAKLKKYSADSRLDILPSSELSYRDLSAVGAVPEEVFEKELGFRWIESRKLRGDEHKRYMGQYKTLFERRPWR